MSKENIDESRLSPEELAAINGDDAGEELEALDDVLASDAGADDSEDLENDDDGGNDESSQDNAAGTEELEAIDDDSDTAEFVPQVTAPQVENYTDKMQAFSQQKADLLSKLRDGDIDIEQYEIDKNAIIEQEFELKLAQREYENSIRQQQQTAKQKWEWEQERFFESDANKVYRDEGILGTAMSAALNKKVIELANDPANAKRSGSWFLNEADRQVREAMNLAPAKQQQQSKQRKPDLSSIPKTLSNLPAAETTETGSNEFSYLDKLDGVELEQALASIARDPVKEARYLRQA